MMKLGLVLMLIGFGPLVAGTVQGGVGWVFWLMGFTGIGLFLRSFKPVVQAVRLSFYRLTRR